MNIIEVNNLLKHFGNTKAVDGISFAVKEAEIVGFLGPNGAGKTTTIHCMLDYIRPQSGNVTILGQDVRREGAQIRQELGFLPAEIHLYPHWTGREHIDLFKAIKRKESTEDDLIAKLDYDPSKKVKNLSTGNKQKLALILALMHHPKVIILDEPTTGLDPLLQQTIYDILRERVKNGATVFMSSHNLPEVERVCDRAIIINRGKIESIEEISKMRQRKVYTVQVTFAGKIPAKLATKTITIVRTFNGTVELAVRGEIEELLDLLRASKAKVADLQITHASLEQMFFEFYKR